MSAADDALALYEAAGCRCPEDAFARGIDVHRFEESIDSVIAGLRADPAAFEIEHSPEWDTATSELIYVDLAPRPDRTMEFLGVRIPVLEIVLSRIAAYAWMVPLQSVLEDFLEDGQPIWMGRHLGGEPPPPLIVGFQERAARLVSQSRFRLLRPIELARPMQGYEKCPCSGCRGREAILENLLFGTDTWRPR